MNKQPRTTLLHLATVAAASLLCSCAAPDPTHNAEAKPGHGHSHGPLVHRFEDAERWAKDFDAADRDAWQRPADVVALARIEPGMTVADLGAGTGYFLGWLSRAVGPHGTVLALDIEPDMVRYMTARIEREALRNVRPLLVPHDDPRLPAGAVDRVLIVNTWHHIPERPEYVRKLAAGLAPGGAVVVVDITLESAKGPPREHRVRPEDVARELEAGGLVARILAETLPEQYAVDGRLPVR
jgi:predicted methyltransferase